MVGALLLFALPVQGQAPWAGDARLEQRVTVEAEGLPVGELLAGLSQKTGVALSARGEAADEKVIVFVRRRPLRALLEDLAALFDDTWERRLEAEGAPAHYELFLGQKARNRERHLARAAIERLAAQAEEYVKALALAPEELNRRSEDDPVREFLSVLSNRTGIALYALLTPAQRETLWTRRRLSAGYADLTAAQQNAVASVLRDLIARLQKMAELYRNNPNVRIAVPRLEDLVDGSVQFRVQRIGGNAMLLLRLPGGAIPLARTEASSAWLLPPHGDPYDPRHPAPPDPLPAPDAVRAALDAGKALSDRLRRLAQESSFSLLSDYYRSRPLVKGESRESRVESRETTDLNAQTPERLAGLDSLCREPGYLWWRRGETLLFRKRDWYLQKAAEVPDNFYRIFTEHLTERWKTADSLPSVADLLLLRALTPAQLAGMGSLFSPLMDESQMDGLPELLAVIAALPPRRAEALLGAQRPGLAAQDISPSLLPRVRAFAEAQGELHSSAAVEGFALRFACTRPPGSAFTKVELRWNLGRANGLYLLFLPHALPDDRTARTRIEREESE